MPPIASPANRFSLDYRAQARSLGVPVVPIIDIHTHVAGQHASKIYDQVRRAFGVRLTYSMTQLPGVQAVKDALGDSVRFIAFPTFSDPDKHRSHRQGFLDAVETFHGQHGSRMLKIWNSPRLREIFPGDVGTDLVEMDSPWRVKACELGQQLGMMFMTHVADPDTWFRAKYADSSKFRTKPEQYIGLERMLDRFTAPWIAAHMGGWPEDLGFLDGMLTRHPNLHLDTSATKWVVRELSMHPREETAAFFTKWKGRVLFGSDIVVTEDHLKPQKETTHPMADLADSPESAFDLYASRYYTLRTMLETTYEGESPIADPDLMMVDPTRYDRMSAPNLRGLGLSPELLKELYAGTAERVVLEWERTH